MGVALSNRRDGCRWEQTYSTLTILYIASSVLGGRGLECAWCSQIDVTSACGSRRIPHPTMPCFESFSFSWFPNSVCPAGGF